MGDGAKDGAFTFTAKLTIGEQHGCSAALVDEQWLITAASCFADSPAQDFKIAAGAPKLKTTATIGRTGTTGEAGQTRDVVELVPRQDRDLVMARMATPVTGIAAVGLPAKAPTVGEDLLIAGYGRTKTEWVPDRLHSATFSVASVKDSTLRLTGKSPDAVMCQGDTGGPAFRQVNGRYELATVHSRFWQGGCLGSDPKETRTGAVDTRVDDVTGWIQQVRSLPKRYATTTGDFDGDGKADVAMLTDYGPSKDGMSQAALWVHTANGEGFREPRVVWETGAAGALDAWRWDGSKLTSGDFNGDGKTDIGVLYGYGKTSDGASKTGLWTFTSNGNGFNAPEKVWESGSGAWKSWNWENSKVTAGDFNGDGKADLAVLYGLGKNPQGRNETTLMTFTSNGNGFAAPVKVWESGTDSWNWNTSKLTSGDFNGDKKADLAILYGYGKTSDGRNETALFFTSNGNNGFSEPHKAWDSNAWTSGGRSWNWDTSKVAAGDFNGDGKADVAVLYGYDKTNDGRNKSALWMFYGTDTGFRDPLKLWESGVPGSIDAWNWNASELTAGDFNGDGKTDVGITYDYGQSTDGRNETGLWTFTSKGDGFNEPRKVWTNKL
ncbi:FG-GAP-like repeat-containing protein [Streptomyces hesseae]|uniref:FG-GAP-like repeat-containing protein n=1 Tax=Streptomyces hesseae TaxID=3075519 RepID=A0ABU2SPP6_9ACTN|nr:FG-GAP-like repeat-containing protein [Streptomyces sp. DSM 40473]MDT0450862.1 FG-GAP-like repeat-containing protein [Streptomyces sp. DSM 40473]